MLNSKNILKRINKARIQYEFNKFIFRPHLGASIIGDECARKIFYTFRWAIKPKLTGKQYRIFETGTDLEKRILEDLKRDQTKYTLYTKAQNGKQFSVVDCYGHFGGSLDSVLTDNKNIIYVVECKTAKEVYYNQVKKHGVQKTYWTYYVQMCCYGFLLGIKYFFFIILNKNISDYHIEIGKIDHKIGKRYIKRAHEIIFTNELPLKISLTATHFKCQLCAYRDLCHYDIAPLKTCRSCLHYFPIKESDLMLPSHKQPNGLYLLKGQNKGAWHCNKKLCVDFLKHNSDSGITLHCNKYERCF